MGKYIGSFGKTTYNGGLKKANMNVFIFGSTKNNSRMCGSNKKRKVTGKKKY